MSFVYSVLRGFSVVVVLYVRLRKYKGFKLFKFDWWNASYTVLNDFYITPSPSGLLGLSLMLLTESLGTLGEMSGMIHFKSLRIAQNYFCW